ncbi:hypothetical protein JHK87_055854 [Glycine soja]|nr:hypothetical protein JHK87_055854 [Glycine soja]
MKGQVVWHTASLYHLVHTAALVASPITKHPNVFGGLLTTGILAFSGTRLDNYHGSSSNINIGIRAVVRVMSSAGCAVRARGRSCKTTGVYS